MRIRVLSDLHREFGHVELPEVEADIVVLAGDTDRGVRGVRWAIERFSPTPVLYLAGNHEFYGKTFERVIPALREVAAGTAVHVLENEVFEFGGYRFFGATLWTDFALFPEQRADAMLRAGDRSSGMNDYKKVRTLPRYQRLRPAQTAMHHAESLQLLSRFLAEDPAARSVVLTHHAPSPKSLLPGWEADPLSAAYASNLETLIEGHNAHVWIHGHIHAFRDYVVGRTRIICNPLGYQGDTPQQTGFRPDFVVDLPNALTAQPG